MNNLNYELVLNWVCELFTSPTEKKSKKKTVKSLFVKKGKSFRFEKKKKRKIKLKGSVCSNFHRFFSKMLRSTKKYKVFERVMTRSSDWNFHIISFRMSWQTQTAIFHRKKIIFYHKKIFFIAKYFFFLNDTFESWVNSNQYKFSEQKYQPRATDCVNI